MNLLENIIKYLAFIIIIIYFFDVQFKYFSIKEIQRFIHENDLAIHKRFGQNFLIDPKAVDTITGALSINKDDLVMEIGCGLGSLTHKIIETNCTVIGFEIDFAYIKLLKEIFKENKNFRLVEGDFLKKIAGVFKEIDKKKYKRILFFGNLPYYLTTPILEKIFETPIYFDEMIFMVQKEVAERIVSKEGIKKYGSLSIFCQYYSIPKIVATLSPRSFFPSPKVESSIVHFKRTEKPKNILNKDFFFKVVRSLFINRRKQLINNISLSPILNIIEKEKIMQVLKITNIPPTIRGEMLSIEKIAELANELYKIINIK